MLSATKEDEGVTTKNIHSLDGNSSAVLDNHLVDLGVAGDIQVGVDSTGRMDVCMRAVAAAASLDTIVSYQRATHK